MVEGKLRKISQCSSAFLAALGGYVTKITTALYTVQQAIDGAQSIAAIVIQPNTGNNQSELLIKPSGTATGGSVRITDDTDETDAGTLSLGASNGQTFVVSEDTGGGAAPDLAIDVGAVEWLLKEDKSMTFPDAGQLNLGATTGTKIGAATDKIGFYNATPVAKQTGVAVTAAGIHAALVNLGLISA